MLPQFNVIVLRRTIDGAYILKIVLWRTYPNLPTQLAKIAIMPRYYFNTRLGDDLVTDPEGEELRDPDHAWGVARAMIRQLLKAEATEARLLSATLEVTDQDGEIVLEFPFTEALIDMGEASPTRH